MLGVVCIHHRDASRRHFHTGGDCDVVCQWLKRHEVRVPQLCSQARIEGIEILYTNHAADGNSSRVSYYYDELPEEPLPLLLCPAFELALERSEVHHVEWLG